MTFAERLRSLREQKGLTQQQLADAAGIPIGTLRDYEQGKRRHDPSLAVVVKIAAALGTDCRAFADCVLKETSAKAKRKNRS